MGRKKVFEVEEEVPQHEDEEIVMETPDEEPVLEVQDCACDHTTRASGFCKHGNNI